jgi:hypothetical protein
MKKLFFSIALVLVLLAGQTGAALAQDTTPISGTVQNVALETDSAGTTTVVVTYTFTDSTGVQQTSTASLSVETAASLGLVTTDTTTGTTTVKDTANGSTVTIDPATILPEPEEEKEHPVGSALSDFFSETLGVDYDVIMEYHADGFGFGVIAQGLWMTKQLGGDSSTFAALLDAKKSGDYSGITLADGSTPRNWGDVIKSLKKGSNLGSVKSGHANSDATATETDQKGNSDKGGDKGGGKGGDKGKGKGKP